MTRSIKRRRNFKVPPYVKYHLRWQLGIVFTLPCMYLFQDVLKLDRFWTIVLFQFVGACLFWFVDRWIFAKKSEPTQLQTVERQADHGKAYRDRTRDSQYQSTKAKGLTRHVPEFHRVQHKG